MRNVFDGKEVTRLTNVSVGNSAASDRHESPVGGTQLLTHPGRLTKVLHRAPHATDWTAIGLDDAMDRIADLVWETRRRTFVRTAGELEPHGEPRGPTEPGDRDAPRTPLDPAEPVHHTTAIAHLGGATLDNEENYLIKKLFTGGLGMVAVSNQARI